MLELIPFVFVALAGAAVYFFIVRRQKEMRALAERLGFQPGDGSVARGLPVFGGYSPRVTNCYRGLLDGVEAAFFDLSTGSGKQRRTRTVCLARFSGASIPALRLRRENFLDKVVAALYSGWADVNFEQDPDFSSQWHLWAEDEAAARLYFTPDKRRRLLVSEGAYVLEARGELVALYHSNRQQIGGAAMEDFLRSAVFMARAVAGR